MNGAAEQIWQDAMALAQLRADTRLNGFSVEVLPSIDSTNTELMRRARAGQHEPTLLVAQEQTAGRGRLGREWVSQKGGSLTFSLGMVLAPTSWEGLSLAAGVSIAQSLEQGLGLSCEKIPGQPSTIQLKWPNDLWHQDCKLAGILIETTGLPSVQLGADTYKHPGAAGVVARYAVVGVGINIAPQDVQGLRTPPTCLQALQPKATADNALAWVAVALLRDLLEFEVRGFAPFAPRFANRDALYGRQIILSDGMQGRGAGADVTGALVVHTATGLQRVSSAEVSVRPA